MLVGRHAQTRGHTREEPDTQGDCTHRRGSPQGADQTPTRRGHMRTRPGQTQTDPTGGPPPRGQTRTRQPASPGRPHQTSPFTRGPGTRPVQAPSECVHGVCVCLYVCKETTSEARALFPQGSDPASPPPSPGSQPRTQASNHSSPLLPGEMGGWMQIPAGHPVAFSADSSWEGPPRSGQRPDHHLDAQAWGSPTAIAAR